MTDAGDILLSARHVTKRYAVSRSFFARLLGRSTGEVHAVDDVDLDVRRGETFGLVGESGCGKTTLGRLLLKLVDPTSGTIEFDGARIEGYSEAKMRPLRRRMGLVFQDPHASLNPAMSVGDAVAHPLVVHGMADWPAARARAAELLEEVGLAPASRFFTKRPAELSGGQKQRVVIARAIATRPDFVVADEPVSMLDMSVRAKILELLLQMKKKYDLTLVFITHDLATARFLCDRLAIMYLGQVVETGAARDLLAKPEHPYAQALVKAIPAPDPRQRRAEDVPRGEVPDAVHPPPGCRFHPRCPVATPGCGHVGADAREAAESWLTRAQPGPRAKLVETQGAPIGWRVAGNDLLLSSADVGPLKRAIQQERPVVWDAVESVEADRLRFRAPVPIELRRRPDGRLTRCVLYDDSPGDAGLDAQDRR